MKHGASAWLANAIDAKGRYVTLPSQPRWGRSLVRQRRLYYAGHAVNPARLFANTLTPFRPLPCRMRSRGVRKASPVVPVATRTVCHVHTFESVLKPQISLGCGCCSDGRQRGNCGCGQVRRSYWRLSVDCRYYGGLFFGSQNGDMGGTLVVPTLQEISAPGERSQRNRVDRGSRLCLHLICSRGVYP